MYTTTSANPDMSFKYSLKHVSSSVFSRAASVSNGIKNESYHEFFAWKTNFEN